jgi:hypothetical protein
MAYRDPKIARLLSQGTGGTLEGFGDVFDGRFISGVLP